MKIYVAGDHAGFELKNILIPFIENLGHGVEDMGSFDMEPTDDYPDMVSKVALAVASNIESMGIIVGGSGQGEAMVANRTLGVRAAVFYGPVMPKTTIDIEGTGSTDPFAVVRLERAHNNANVLSLGARFVSIDEAETAVRIFLDTAFSSEERHQRRIEKF